MKELLTSSQRRVLIVLFILALIVFGYSLNFDFVLDDENQILNNERIHSLWSIPDAFTGSTMDALGAKKLGGIYYKPIMTCSYILLWAISGTSFPFHVFQLILHVFNAFLIQRFFLTFDQFKKNELFALILASVYLIHPINVETVVHIADLQDVLFTFFGLLALNLMTRSYWSNWTENFLLFGLLELSLLSKESGILSLLITGLYCGLFRKKKWPSWLGVALSVIALYLFLRIGVAELTHGANSSQMLRASLPVRLLSMPKVFAHYIEVFFFPKELTLVQDWVVSEFSAREFFIPLLVVGSFFSGFVFLAWRSQSPLTWFFLIWLILGMGAHSNLVAIDGSVADRWFYFPFIGLLGFLAQLWFQYESRFEKIRVHWKTSFVLLLFFLMGGRTFARTLDWESGMKLYQHDLALMPDSFYLANNVGVEYFRMGEIEIARAYFQRSTELFPQWVTNWTNLGAAYQRQGKLDQAELCFERSVKNGASALGYQNYANILSILGKKAELKEFLEKTAFRYFPENPILRSIYMKNF
ncbi:MAG: tetratricopeptide repeat protein [Bdellovibrionia bacterium]